MIEPLRGMTQSGEVLLQDCSFITSKLIMHYLITETIIYIMIYIGLVQFIIVLTKVNLDNIVRNTKGE